jgi:hypothetical protein
MNRPTRRALARIGLAAPALALLPARSRAADASFMSERKGAGLKLDRIALVNENTD